MTRGDDRGCPQVPEGVAGGLQRKRRDCLGGGREYDEHRRDVFAFQL